MERFCDRCGSLVSGNVKHCTFCGAEMDKKLVVSSSLDVDTDSIFDSDSPEEAASAAQTEDSRGGEYIPPYTAQDKTHSGANDGAVPYKPQSNSQSGEYIPLYTAQATKQEDEFTTAKWLGILAVSICFGIVSDIILIIWARDDSNMMRRNFARAMLIAAPVVHFGFFMVMLVVAAFILA